MEDSDQTGVITSRITRLNQLLLGRSSQIAHRGLVSRDGLLDALCVLYEECRHEELAKNKNVAIFMEKYASTIKEVQQLRISMDDFEMKDIIGRGHFGKVHVVRERCTGDVYAMKVLRKQDTISQQNVAFYEEERDIMAKATSPWITQLQYAFQDKHNLYLVMEYHPGGDLLSLLCRYDDQFEEGMARFYLTEMVLAVHTLHTMGYIHRDVKPENILIDRTGHIKLADFGSACRLEGTHSQKQRFCKSMSVMPVGTPDYISPESLLKMNEECPKDDLGPECDWWSLGVCAYEMLFGQTPFSTECGSTPLTYANIMNYKKCLKFPQDAGVSDKAVSLIQQLLTDRNERLNYEGICSHRFFSEVDFNSIRHTRPPFIPTVSGMFDTSNFDVDDTDKNKPSRQMDDMIKTKGFSGKDLPFIGFTFTKDLQDSSVIKSQHQGTTDSSLERRLTMKTRELELARERTQQLEAKQSENQMAVRELEQQLKKKDGLLAIISSEKDQLEEKMVHQATQIKSLQRQLEIPKQEKLDFENLEAKVTGFQEAFRTVCQEREQTLREMACLRDYNGQLEQNHAALQKKTEKLKRENEESSAQKQEQQIKISQLQTLVSQLKDDNRFRSDELAASLEEKEQAFAAKEAEMKRKLDKALQQSYEATELLQRVRQSKNALEDELYQLKEDGGGDSSLMLRLTEVEEQRRKLEQQVCRLEVAEQRLQDVQQESEEKSHQMGALATKITDLEEEVAQRDLSIKKSERLHQQREQQLADRISELEEQLRVAQESRSDMEESSFMVTQENEEKLHRIHEQEMTITKLKANIIKLEDQVNLLRLDLQRDVQNKTVGTSPIRSPTRKSSHSHTPLRSTPRKSKALNTSFSLSSAATTDNWTEMSFSTIPNGHWVVDEISDITQNDEEISDNKEMSDKGSNEAASGNGTDEWDQNEADWKEPAAKQEREVLRQNADGKLYESAVELAHPGSDSQDDGHDSHSTDIEDQDSPSKVHETSYSPTKGYTVDSHGRKKEYESYQKVQTASVSTTETGCETSFIFPTPETKCCCKHSCHSPSTPQDNVLSDLQEEKTLLELRVKQLSKEVDQYKDSTHEQRLRALDFKFELKEKSEKMEKDMQELRERLNKAELELSESSETASALQQTEKTLRAKLDRLQKDHDELRLTSRNKITHLEEKTEDLQKSLVSTQAKCKDLENVDNKLQLVNQKCSMLEPKTRELEEQLRSAQEDKARFRMEADRLRDELKAKTRQHDLAEERLQQLKSVCTELESQLQDYETLNQVFENKEHQWTSEKNVYEKAVDEREDELLLVQKQLSSEKQARQRLSCEHEDLKKFLASTKESYEDQLSRIKQQLREQTDHAQHLNSELTQVERRCSLMEIEVKKLSQQLEVEQEGNVRLKEEMSSLLTRCHELKGTNFKLSQNLEDALAQCDHLKVDKQELENDYESRQLRQQHEKFKLESTLGQQTKLIDYLQAKVENPPKKKKGLFGGKKPQDMTPAQAAYQFRELQNTLEHEKDKNATLRNQVTKLRDELDHVKTASLHGQPSKFQPATPQATLKPNHATPGLSSIVMSPSMQPSPAPLFSPATARRRVASKPKQERMQHNIPHRFITGLNSRATKCAVCLGSVLFVKQAAKCQECWTVCHPKCAADLPATCGLPTEYARHYTDMMNQAKKVSTTRLSVADLRLQLTGYMKIPRPGKQLWEKKWVVLADNKVKIYDSKSNNEPTEEFDLCPSNGDVTVHSAVTAADLTNTASSDLPYILKLDYQPETTCWPGRTLHLMALTFPEKQRWAATLEAIVSHNPSEGKDKETKLIGNSILMLQGEQQLQINCTLVLSEEVILLGSDEGLSALPMKKKTQNGNPILPIKGISGVCQMEAAAALNLIVMISGTERQLMLVNTKSLSTQVSQACQSGQSLTLTPMHVQNVKACTTFAMRVFGEGIYICVATAEKILIMKYNLNQGQFVIKKELLTSQPCSCIYFSSKYVVVGTDKFYKIDLTYFNMSDLLDKKDTSLAFAAFGASHFDSFPIAVLNVASDDDPDEYLLCFHEYGVFVNSSGRRSREIDMKWNGLPLDFAYSEPYLYICYFNSLQVMEILPSHYELGYGGKSTINITSPRYLGHAQTPGAIYVGSMRDMTSEVMCIRGNMKTSTEEFKENCAALANQMKPGTTNRSSSRSKKAGARVTFQSPVKSPPNIRRLSSSPTRRVCDRTGAHSAKLNDSMDSIVSDTSSMNSAKYSSSSGDSAIKKHKGSSSSESDSNY